VKVPEPRQSKRRASAASRVLLWTFLIFLLGAAGIGAFGYYMFQQYTAPGPLAENKVFTVEQGLGTPEIAAALEQNGVISNARIFSAMSYVTGTRARLKAGEYAFAPNASMRDVMALIASGKSITYKLSVPEGLTSEMAVARVNANDILTGSPAAIPAEGSIMPDTFIFRRGMTRQQLVDEMQAAQAKLLEDLWSKRVPVPVIDTKEQAVTLASIVEKETGVAAERPIIASVFINRLKKGMRLQSDPTIIYGIAGGKGKLDRALTRADIETETSYNTYRINGLPPGPIANPGRAALEAVLNPPATDYLYFVADGSGGHAFATTLDEHNRNVKKWREIAGNAAAAAAAAEEPAAPPAVPAAVNAPAAAAEPVGPAPPAAEIPAAQIPAAQIDVPPPAAPPADVLNPPPAPVPTLAEEAVAPKPAAAQPAETEPVAEPVAVEPPPTPKPKPAQAALKPGAIVTVDGRQVVIPKPKPRR
jgi:UPF0755 protein